MKIHGDKGQAGNVQPERLNPRNSYEYAIVQTGNESLGGGNNKTSRLEIGQIESNRMIDARISFYGTYCQLNEQVTLQNQDPKSSTINCFS